MRRLEWQARRVLSDWPFWVVVCYFGLVALVVALYLVNGRTARANTATAREAAVREAQAHSRETQCLASRPQLMKINRFVRGVQEFHTIIAQNTKAILDSTPRDAPDYQLRLRNYRRVVPTVADVSGVHFHVPSVAECHRLGKS